MRHRLVAFFACALCALCVSHVLPSWAVQITWGKLRVASGVVPVRESPNLGATKVRSLKNGQLVRIDFENDGWAAVFDPAQKKRSESAAWGYARLDSLRFAGALDLPRTPMTSSRAPLESIEVSKGAEAEESRPKNKKNVAVHAAKGNETEAPAAPAESDRRERPVSAEDKGDRAAAKAREKSAKGIINAGKDAAKFGKVTPAPKKAETPRPAHPPKPFGEIRVADRDLAIRAQRTKESEFVTLLRPGQRVRVDFLEDGFYAVFDADETVRDLSRARGYSRDKFLLTEKEYAEAVKAAAPVQKTLKEPQAAAAKPGTAAKQDAKGNQSDHGNATQPQREPVAAPPSAAKKLKENDTAEAKQNAAAPQSPAAAGPVLAYTVLERRADPLRPFAPPVVRIRLDSDQPPTGDALRHVVREIWNAEHHGAGEMQLEVFLPGAEANSLAYAVARFAKDGRLRDFLWRESLLRIKN